MGENKKIAILDSSALMSFYTLNCLELLNLFYDKVLIPRQVEKEFVSKHPELGRSQNERFIFLINFYQQNSWLLSCQEYGGDLVDLYKTEKNIDAGEAEVFAQNQHWDSRCELILDEKNARKFADKKQLQKRGVLGLLAEIAIRFGRIDYQQALKLLTSNERNFYINQTQADKIYEEIKKQLL